MRWIKPKAVVRKCHALLSTSAYKVRCRPVTPLSMILTRTSVRLLSSAERLPFRSDPFKLLPMQQQAIKQPPKTSAISKDEGMKLHRKCGCNHKTAAEGECEECKKNRDIKLQRAPANAQRTNEGPEQVYDVLQSPGHPLDPPS